MISSTMPHLCAHLHLLEMGTSEAQVQAIRHLVRHETATSSLTVFMILLKMESTKSPQSIDLHDRHVSSIKDAFNVVAGHHNDY